MTKKIAYVQLEETLNELKAQINAAEVHGLLLGMLCLAKKPISEPTIQASLVENLDCLTPTKKQAKIFSKLITQITNDLTGVSFGLNLLLPDDNDSLEERLIALGYWCRGYLSGLGLVGITSDDLKNNDIVKELVHDLSQIAHVNMDTDGSEEDEQNYMELVEYVRIAVQNINLELSNDNLRGIDGRVYN